ncbi:MAG: TRAP transporter permease, partial [Halopseudomonas sp.]
MTTTHKAVSEHEPLTSPHGEPLTPIVIEGVDDEPIESNRRQYGGWLLRAVTALAILYSAFHLYVLNISPMESWSFRIVHVTGALILGYLFFSGSRFVSADDARPAQRWTHFAALALMIPATYALVQTAVIYRLMQDGTLRMSTDLETWHYGWPL